MLIRIKVNPHAAEFRSIRMRTCKVVIGHWGFRYVQTVIRRKCVHVYGDPRLEGEAFAAADFLGSFVDPSTNNADLPGLQ